MDADLKKIKKLARAMRKEGLLTYKTADIELSLSPQALFREDSQDSSQSTKSDELTDTIDPMDALLWSAPGSEEAN